VDQEFLYAAKLTDLLYKRLHYKRLVHLIVREAANFYYSRLKVSDSQTFAKSQMIYLIREARHVQTKGKWFIWQNDSFYD